MPTSSILPGALRALAPRSKTRSLMATALATASIASFCLTGLASGAPALAASTSSISGTINWWGWTPTDTAEATAEIAAFNKQYPHVTVNFKLVSITDWVAALRPALASGDGPDVFDMQPGAYVTEFNSYAENLAPVAQQALGSSWKSKVAPSGVTGLSYGAKLTALSVGSVYAGTLWVNENLFNKYKLTPPTTLATWVQDCKVFKAHGQGCFVQGDSQEGFDQDTLQSIANSVQPGLWTKASDGQAKWSSAGIVKALTIWKQLFSDGIMQSGALGFEQYPDANNAFLTGQYAMIMMGTWYMENVTSAGMTSAMSAAGVTKPKPFPILPVAFPNVAGAGNKSEMYGDSDFGLSVYTQSKNKPAAEAFVKWLTTSTAGQQAVANQLDDLPALRSVQPNFNIIKLVKPATQLPAVRNLIKTVGSVNEPRESLLSSDVQNAILAAASSVATGSASPLAAAKTLQSAAVKSGEKFK
jgi:raffinose/stachyose/melibiose transport system substrate-binding protein